MSARTCGAIGLRPGEWIDTPTGPVEVVSVERYLLPDPLGADPMPRTPGARRRYDVRVKGAQGTKTMCYVKPTERFRVIA